MPHATAPQRRAAVHRLVDEILDRRPDLETKITDLMLTVSARLSDPGIAAQVRLFTAGKGFLDALNQSPPSAPGGFTATAAGAPPRR